MFLILFTHIFTEKTKMAISDLYSTGKHKQEIGHFANIVKIAKADGEITEGEEALLIKAGKSLNITVEESILILINPEKFPTNPPASYDDRIERLYRLAKMILVDGDAKLPEVKLMRKIAIGLNFSNENAEKVCDEAIHLVSNKNDLNDFIVAIKKVDSV
ncbi:MULTISPECIES: TerB family tellurite resistance protein [unclassified Polaribacter]|uniref:TerB family tellurite resistance protein n=1 Tax=unclassified Polaribacter TaxID=196858 RepID=UPI0011BEE685|nr:MULTISPECIES: TerB family tellurite resistance protein [unclassified Polaribacter]TXD52792.1 TerB family tellurite resistance protein [Polaribacter sp. IC063]TXD61669.1 TerB family tellurite resistance protein [Polaribacter sp. IC066]